MDEEIPGYRYNPCYIPQPYFLSGYRGYIPHMLDTLGHSYGQTTHVIARQDPLLAERLATLGVEKTRAYWRDLPLDVNQVLQQRYRKNLQKELLPVCCCCDGCAVVNRCGPGSSAKDEDIPICVPLAQVQQKSSDIPDYICPGYTGCASLKRRGVLGDPAVARALKDFNRDQGRWGRCPSRLYEDPFPGPPPSAARVTSRNKNGQWVRFPDPDPPDQDDEEY